MQPLFIGPGEAEGDQLAEATLGNALFSEVDSNCNRRGQPRLKCFFSLIIWRLSLEFRQLQRERGRARPVASGAGTMWRGERENLTDGLDQ